MKGKPQFKEEKNPPKSKGNPLGTSIDAAANT